MSREMSDIHGVLNWQELASEQLWWRIDAFALSNEEHDELFDRLSRIVPTREWGDGIETYDDFIRPSDASNWIEYSAAELLWNLRRQEPLLASHQPFRDALSLAVSALKHAGIRYDGLHDTYLYFDKNKGWKQVSSRRGKVIFEALHNAYFRLDTDDNGDRLVRPTSDVDWVERYPWRNIFTLKQMYSQGLIEPYTPEWHALQIIDSYHGFRETFTERLEANRNPHVRRLRPAIRRYCTQSRRREIARDLLDIAEFSQTIGMSYEALLRKPYEADALMHIRRKEDAAKGGREKAKAFAPKRSSLFEAVQGERAKGNGPTDELRRIAAQNLVSKAFNHASADHKREFDRLKQMYYREKRRNAAIKSHL